MQDLFSILLGVLNQNISTRSLHTPYHRNECEQVIFLVDYSVRWEFGSLIRFQRSSDPDSSGSIFLLLSTAVKTSITAAENGRREEI